MTDHAITPAITLLARFAKREDAQAEWQAAAEGRRDRHRLASMMVLWALQQVDPDGTCETGLAVATLHQRLLAGDPPPRAEWSRVRRAALAATDRAPRGERVVYEMAEAAAWDPSGASTVLSDTLLPWLIHVSTNAMAACGWTAPMRDENTKYWLRDGVDHHVKRAQISFQPSDVRRFVSIRPGP